MGTLMGRIAETGTVTIERGGKTYRGTWTLESARSPETRMLTLTTEAGSKCTQLGSLPPGTLARMLLGEIVREQASKA